MCDAKEMPHIETRWDPISKLAPLNIHPDPLTMARVFEELVQAFEWTSFTILYENGKRSCHVPSRTFNFWITFAYLQLLTCLA